MDLEEIVAYLQVSDLSAFPGWDSNRSFDIFPLAQGEYNLNYRICQGQWQWVFRVNLGTQINRDDQILYEHRALCLLANTGVTPCPFYVDDMHRCLPHGVLLMEYLPGEPLEYTRDLEAAGGGDWGCRPDPGFLPGLLEISEPRQ